MNPVARDLTRRSIGEAVGTFILVFCGTGAIVVNDLSHGAVTHVGIALTFGLAVLALVHALEPISGCHLNPAVSISLWLARKFPLAELLHYIASQCTGAILASLLIKSLFPEHPTLGATLPANGPVQSFLLEIVLTWMLMLVILCVSNGPKQGAALAGISIGAVVGLEAMFAGPISGASMNPARSLAPALISMQTQHLWVYLLAPILGSVLAVGVFALIKSPPSLAKESNQSGANPSWN
jgi:aquaporin Z